MPTDAERAAISRYHAKLNAITIRIPPEVGKFIRDSVEAAGQSLASYIVQACRERAERDDQQSREWYDHIDMPDPQKEDA